MKLRPPQGLLPTPEVVRRARATAEVAPPLDPVVRDLIAEREQLTERFTLLQLDLGGAFYEMAIRDHIKLDALTRKAAELQRVDAQLQAVEQRLLETR